MIRYKGYSAINILGLGLGMAVCMLIMIWVHDEMSFDRFHENGDSIYRVVADWERYHWDGLEITPAPLATAIKEELPEIKNTCRIVSHARLVFKYKQNRFYEEGGIIADPSLFEIFSFPFVKGEPEHAFNKPSDMVITESIAHKYFGDEDPLGRILDVEGQQITITGVVKDPPANSHLQFDFVSSFEFLDAMSKWTYGWGVEWGEFNFSTYVLARPDIDLELMQKKITGIAEKNKCYHALNGLTFRLQPLSKVYLTARDWDIGWRVLGNRKMVLLFSIIGIFVLVIACINFINLSTARSAVRSREVGMRKTVGARRSQLILQFFAESLTYAGIAGAAAVCITALMLPGLNRISGKALGMDIFSLSLIVKLAAVVLVTGLVSGVYPALFLSSFKPVVLFRREGFRGSRGMIFRTVMVVFQFAVSIVLVFGMLNISRQFNYMKNKDLGFDRENIVYVPIKENAGEQYKIMKHALVQNPSIVSVSAQHMGLSETMRSAGWKWEGRDPEREKNLDLVLTGVDFDYFETMGLEIAEGRHFSEDIPSDARESVILNESAVREMGLDNPLGKWFRQSKSRTATIIGVAKDANFQSLRQKINNRIFYIKDMSRATQSGIILIRIQPGQITQGLAAIQKVWDSANPSSPFEYNFVDAAYERMYENEMTAGTIFNIFTLLAVMLSCMGLWGLSSFMVQQKHKEIGVRKVLGASIPNIFVLLSTRFLKWVLVAVCLAWPAGYFLITRVLESYAYRITIGIGSYILSGAAALALAMLTVAYHSVKAARTRPADALRYE